MGDASDGDQFHFDPVTYLEMIRDEVPSTTTSKTPSPMHPPAESSA
jgi:hypothetical protein